MGSSFPTSCQTSNALSEKRPGLHGPGHYKRCTFPGACLYFTEQQIYFQCSKSSWREDQCLETPPFIQINMPEPATDFSPLLYKASQDLGGSQSQFENYCQTIHLYISRDLTVQDDILNAFSGVIKSYEAAMGYEFFWGVPTKFLINGLVFRSPDVSMSKPGIRRSGFPSWSWTGWLNNEGSKFSTLLGT